MHRLFGRKSQPPDVDKTDDDDAWRDEIDYRLAMTAARLADLHQREAYYRRFRDEYEARRRRIDPRE